VAYAIAWAACTGAELRSLTVLASPVAYTMPDVMSSSELLIESIERQGQELLDRVAAQAERAGIVYSTLLKWGNVPETILQLTFRANFRAPFKFRLTVSMPPLVGVRW
jgi:nucleotide-binding universal stress UspA family protein